MLILIFGLFSDPPSSLVCTAPPGLSVVSYEDIPSVSVNSILMPPSVPHNLASGEYCFEIILVKLITKFKNSGVIISDNIVLLCDFPVFKACAETVSPDPLSSSNIKWCPLESFADPAAGEDCSAPCDPFEEVDVPARDELLYKGAPLSVHESMISILTFSLQPNKIHKWKIS